MKKQKIDHYRIWIKGLVMECPMGQPLDDCPLNVLRGLPLPEINRTVNHLPNQRLKQFVTTHRHCYHHRVRHENQPML